MDKHIESLLSKEKDINPDLLRNDMDGRITTLNYFNKLKEDIQVFDDRAWNLKEGYKSTKFSHFSENLEGWTSGLYIFAGPSNAGKTAIMVNIAEDLCMNKDNKLFCLVLSLDDDKKVVIPRIVAMRENIPIGVVSKPYRYESHIRNGHDKRDEYIEFLEKRQRGIERLVKDSDKLAIFDSMDINDINDLEDTVRRAHNFVKTLDPDANIMVVIDSLKDVNILDGNNLTDNDKINRVSSAVKKLSVELDIIVFGSMHLRKLNANRRPTIDDLKDSNRLEYEASCIFLVFNDISRNKESAKIYAKDLHSDNKIPVLEVDWAKNKVSSYKGRSFCYFVTEHSKAIQCIEEDCRRFTSLLYEA